MVFNMKKRAKGDDSAQPHHPSDTTAIPMPRYHHSASSASCRDSPRKQT